MLVACPLAASLALLQNCCGAHRVTDGLHDQVFAANLRDSPAFLNCLDDDSRLNTGKQSNFGRLLDYRQGVPEVPQNNCALRNPLFSLQMALITLLNRENHPFRESMAPETRPQPAPHRTGFDPLLADILFLSGYVLAYLGIMAVMRAILLYTNLDLAEQVPLADLGSSFLVGLRFDLLITCIVGAPLVLALLLPGGMGTRRLALLWLAVSGAITLFAGVTELE
ncbi:MAG: hypothetical protein PVG72_10230, partial [Gammaproteobacteria bacterium]